MDKLKAFAKFSQDFVDSLIRRCEGLARRNPIEILKRLQREAFSDLMKLRDRQDKVERILSFFKPSKGYMFQEATTHVRGQVDVLGGFLMMDNLNQRNLDAISSSGIRTGVDSRFIFETTTRQNDTLSAEFVASQKGMEHHDAVGTSLSLAKLSFVANFSDWFSLVSIPIGAQCRDVGIASNSFQQGKGLTDISSFGPPLLNLQNGSAIGIRVRKSNIVASLAQFVAGLGMQSGFNAMDKCYSTFGKVMCQFPRGTKLSLLGLRQMAVSSGQPLNVGALAIPILLFKRDEASETVAEASPLLGTRAKASTGSIALMLESELDDVTKIGCWIEMNKLNPKTVTWAVTMSNVSENSFAWGMSLSGKIGDSAGLDHLQGESYLKFNLGNKLCLKPGFAYVMDGSSKIAALMLRSNWSLS